MALRSKTALPSPDRSSNHFRRGSETTARHSDPNEELRLVAEVRSMAHPEDYVIGGQIDHEREEVLLVRGDFSQIRVPFAWFSPTRTGLAPDFDDFEIRGTGETLRFGEYEAPVFAVLGQHDLRMLGEV
jgi:hypothetical protein